MTNPILSDAPKTALDGQEQSHRERLLGAVRKANDTSRTYPASSSIPAVFREVVDAWSSREALLHAAPGGGIAHLTYGELAERAGRLARVLVRHGVGPETRVALAVERSPETLVAILAVLEAGGCYVPVDPAYPAERQAFLVEDSGCPLLLSGEGVEAAVPGAVEVLALADLEAEARDVPRMALPAPHPEQLAYVMYTSGSTGVPKGVAVTHRNVVRLVRGSDFAGFGPEHTWLLFAPISFDASTLEIWGPLLNGGRLAVHPPGKATPAELVAAVQRFGVDHLWLTAGLFHQVAESGLEGLEGLRRLLSGGDVLSPAHVARVREELPGVELVNGYGPTENTTFTTTHQISEGDGSGAIPIGRPIANTRVVLLDRHLEQVVPGEEGELLAGGDGVARGYLGRPALTAERFVPDPSGRSGERLYRTGDRARWRLPDGEGSGDGAQGDEARGDGGAVLDFRGRLDHQVKIRGFRIEPGEVEGALASLPGVAAAAVVVREPVLGDKRLVGYAVPAGGAELDVTELRSALAQRLPDHMVPARFVLLDEMPLTANGKVDRRALPAPGADRPDLSTPYREPAKGLESRLAALWCQMLGLEKVGADDDLIELGGHSLLAARIAARVRDEMGVELGITDVFAHPTVAALAARVEAVRATPEEEGLPPLVPLPSRDGDLPLNFPQEQVWFHQRLAPDSLAYNTQFTLRLRGALDPDVLARTLTEIVRRHESLRTTFHKSRDRGVQRVHEPWEVDVETVDVSGLPPEEADRRLAEVVDETVRVPFDVGRLPLVRWRVVRTRPREYHLIHVEHHFIHDGWSVSRLLREIVDLYPSVQEGRPSPLPPLPVQLGDYAVWQRGYLQGDLLERKVDFFVDRLEGYPVVLDLPTDRPRPHQQSFRGARLDSHLPGDLYEALRQLSQRRGVTLFTTMLAAFQALLARYAGQERFLVGSAVANRHPRQAEPLIGMLVNTVVLRADVSADPAFGDLLRRVKDDVVPAWQHQDTPVERLVARLEPERDLSRNPLFQVMFSFHDSAVPDVELPGTGGEVVRGDMVIQQNASAKSDFNVIVQPRAQQRMGREAREEDRDLQVHWEYSTDLFDAATVERLWNAYVSVLRQVVERPAMRVSELVLLSDDERARVLETWNDTGRDHDLATPVFRRVEAVAAQRGGAPAVVDAEGATTSHGELAEASLRLAAELHRRGVGRGDRVAVCCARSPHAVAAVLGVARTGAAYLPLDRHHPAERLEWTLRDAAVTVVLADAETAGELPEVEGLAVLRVDGELAPHGDFDPAAVHVEPEDLAYVIYTSGSTGRPKGVEVTHGGLANLVSWHLAEYGLGPEDRCSHLAGPAFDASVWELWPALAAGAALHLPDDRIRTDPERLRDWLLERGVTVGFVPTPLADRMVLLEWPREASLRALLTGGDALHRFPPPELPWRLVNHYGPTENTVVATAGEVPVRPAGADSAERPHIGGPIDNVRALVLDPWLRVAGIGVPGELYVAGAGLARGYHGRPGLTADRFRPDPFADGGRAYRTGDRVRWLAVENGEEPRLEFRGRVDYQVQVRGFRVEPGEIEAVLASLPGVGGAAVVPVAAPSGEILLVGYWEPAADAEAEEETLRAALGRRLPDYMVPARLVRLDALPVNRSGKVDRKALPEPSFGSEDDAFVAPRNELEELVAELWTEVLAVETVGVKDHFFRLGGHSMAATRLTARLGDLLELEVPLGLVFDHPVLAAFCEVLEERLLADEEGS